MQQRIQSMTGLYATRGGPGPGAVQRAYASIYGTVQQQATVLAYRDTIVIMAIIIVAVMPLVLLARNPKPEEIHLGH